MAGAYSAVEGFRKGPLRDDAVPLLPDGNDPWVRRLSTQGTLVQDNMIQPAMLPFIKLAQANMELLTKFSLSPEGVSQSAALMQQAQQAAASLAQSNAFAQLTQGMLKNYTEFMTEWGQGAMATLAQGQAAMVARTQEVTGNVVDAAEARSRRSR